MKTKISTIMLTLFVASVSLGQIGIGTTSPNSSSALDITSTSLGFLMPRMTTTQRVAIATPAEGLLVFDTTTKSIWVVSNTVWTVVGNGGKFVDGDSANDAVYTVGNVGIKTTAPKAALDVNGYIKVGSTDQNADSNPAQGMLRFNATTSKFQVYTSTAWVDLN